MNLPLGRHSPRGKSDLDIAINISDEKAAADVTEWFAIHILMDTFDLFCVAFGFLRGYLFFGKFDINVFLFFSFHRVISQMSDSLFLECAEAALQTGVCVRLKQKEREREVG